jgi:isopenicillin N synthase-like dioxygenase
MGRKLLESIAAYLKLERHWFDDKVGEGNSVLRVIHYPPLAEGRPACGRARTRTST